MKKNKKKNKKKKKKKKPETFPIEFKGVVLDHHSATDNGSRLLRSTAEGTQEWTAPTQAPKTKEYLRLDFPVDYAFDIDNLFKLFRPLIKKGRNRLRFIYSQKAHKKVDELRQYVESVQFNSNDREDEKQLDNAFKERLLGIESLGTRGTVFKEKKRREKISKRSTGKTKHRPPKVSPALWKMIREKWESLDHRYPAEEDRKREIGILYRGDGDKHIPPDPVFAEHPDYERAKDLTDDQLKKYAQTKTYPPKR